MLLKRIVWIITGLFAVALLALIVAYWRSDNACEDISAIQGDSMQAIVNCDYGSPDVLKIETIAKPTPADDEVLVKIRAAAVNPLDWHFMRGKPYIVRLFSGLRKPEDIRLLGTDYAGTITAVGKKVVRFKPGDQVFGGNSGTLAEYIVAAEDGAIALKPVGVTHEQAASVPVAALTALQGLRDKGKLQPGQKLLINGASGGVGTFAVQIAKSMGAEVTGVSSGRNHAMVRSIGADHMVDYTREDFTKGEQRYDVIFDLVGNHTLAEYRRVLKPEGILVISGGPGLDDGQWVEPFVPLIQGLIWSPFVSQSFVDLLAQLNREDLVILGDLMQQGKVKPVIDKRYQLSESADAIRYLETGRARGKVIITIN